MTNPADKFTTPRVAAGALFVDGSRVLLVRKTYGNRWDIPGGYVDRGETPMQACVREIREELGLNRHPTRVLVHDWAPNDKEGDKLLFVFDCGDLGDDEDQIVLDQDELDRFEWVEVAQLADYVIPRLERRLAESYRAKSEGFTLYLEHGEPVESVPRRALSDPAGT